MIKSYTNENAYIGILDILGFKDLVQRNSHKELLDIYLKLDMVISLIYDIQDRGGEALNEDENFDFSKIKYNKIQSFTISDSIILWSEDDSKESFIEMVGFVSMLLQFGIFIGIPLRGAISMGALSVMSSKLKRNAQNFNTTLVGKGLVNAYEYEVKQNWSGCIVDKKCIIKLRNQKGKVKREIDDFIRNFNLIKHKVPFKDGPVEIEYAVNWIPQKYDPDFEKEIVASFAENKKSINNWDVEQKIKNTVEFYRKACLSLNEDGFFLDLEASNIKVLNKEAKLKLFELLKVLAEGDALDGIENIAMGGYFANNEGKSTANTV